MLDKLPPSWRAHITPQTQAQLLIQRRLGLLPEHTGGVDVGPRACPECGVPWPLVPPPCEG